MIGQTDAKLSPGDAHTMLQNAVTWYSNNYTWKYDTAYMYAIYGMFKALTATLGTSGKVGTNDWAADMKNEVMFSIYRDPVSGCGATADGYDCWESGSGFDPYSIAQTSWVLTSALVQLLQIPTVG